LANPKMTLAWFTKAAKAVRVAKVLIDVDQTFLEEVAFHCQQCVEMGIKGFLVFHDIKFKKIHVIETLSALASILDPSLIKILEPAKDFTDYATSYRYPDAKIQKEDLTEEQVREAVKIADVIYQELRARIPLT